jgi:hypothetical protein
VTDGRGRGWLPAVPRLRLYLFGQLCTLAGTRLGALSDRIGAADALVVAGSIAGMAAAIALVGASSARQLRARGG